MPWKLFQDVFNTERIAMLSTKVCWDLKYLWSGSRPPFGASIADTFYNLVLHAVQGAIERNTLVESVVNHTSMVWDVWIASRHLSPWIELPVLTISVANSHCKSLQKSSEVNTVGASFQKDSRRSWHEKEGVNLPQKVKLDKQGHFWGQSNQAEIKKATNGTKIIISAE